MLAPVRAAKLEKSTVQMVVGGKAALQHLPLTLADQLGFFRLEGLTVELTDAGHSLSLIHI